MSTLPPALGLLYEQTLVPLVTKFCYRTCLPNPGELAHDLAHDLVANKLLLPKYRKTLRELCAVDSEGKLCCRGRTKYLWKCARSWLVDKLRRCEMPTIAPDAADRYQSSFTDPVTEGFALVYQVCQRLDARMWPVIIRLAEGRSLHDACHNDDGTPIMPESTFRIKRKRLLADPKIRSHFNII